jgi:beta-glucuronidase
VKFLFAFVLITGLLTCPMLRAEPVIANVYARKALSLDGDWHTIVDPYDNGYLDYRLQPYDAQEKPTGGYFLDRKPAAPSDLVEYNFDTSPVLQVPGDWNSQDEKLLYYEGTVWYRCRQLRGRGLPERPQARAAHRGLHSIPVRGDRKT